VRNWQVFFNATKTWKQQPHKFLGNPRPPSYKPKNGESIAIFSNQQARVRNGYLILPKKVLFTLKTRLSGNISLREVRIIPRGVGYTVEIIYNKTISKPKKRIIQGKGQLI
jgi:putative transposase